MSRDSVGKAVVGFVLVGRLMGLEVRRDVDVVQEGLDQADSALDVSRSEGGTFLL